MSLQELRGLLYEWETLVKTPGWKRLEQYAKDQVDRRVSNLLDITTKDTKFLRGECSGIKLFSFIPEIEIARLRSEIEILGKQIDEENDNADTEDVERSDTQLAP